MLLLQKYFFPVNRHLEGSESFHQKYMVCRPTSFTASQLSLRANQIQALGLINPRPFLSNLFFLLLYMMLLFKQ